MTDPSALAEVRAVILTLVPSSWQESDIVEDLPLGGDGLGLDSVALVELILLCEQRLGVRFPPEVLERGSLTVRTLVDHINVARSRTQA